MKKWGIDTLWSGGVDSAGEPVNQSKPLEVFDHKTSIRRRAEFHTKVAARECQAVVSRLTTAGNFVGSVIVKLD